MIPIMAASSAAEATINCCSSELSSPQGNTLINNNTSNAINSGDVKEEENCNITNDTTENFNNPHFVTTTTTININNNNTNSSTCNNSIDSGTISTDTLATNANTSSSCTNDSGNSGSNPENLIKTPDSDCFTQPLPPSSHPVLRSTSNHSSTPSTRTFDAEGNPNPKPEKVKSRWRRNSELESGHGTEQNTYSNNNNGSCNTLQASSSLANNTSDETVKTSPLTPLNNNSYNIPKEMDPVPQYDHIDENIYLFEKKKSKSKKEMRRMVCNCILTKEERQRGVLGCLEDCLNRMLMIECGNRCLLGDHCANKRFQKRQFAKVEPFKTQKKGWGLRAMQTIQPGQFIVEYVGEVLDPKEFKNRVKKYSKENREHYYFMALKSDEIIDATLKGNLTRFINHSCDPNGETQKWTVNGELRIGFFATRLIEPGEEITFDYQFQRYGKKAQRCYCEALSCRGFIGSTNDTSINIDGSLITPKQRSQEKSEEEEKGTEEEFEDLGLEEEIAKLTASGGIRNRQQTLMLARLMVRAEDTFNRTKLLEVLKGTQEIAYLRLFLDYHGLQLLWSWMVDLEDVYLKGEILEVLAILPIPNKTVLKDSKVLDVVERWSKQAESDANQRKDGVLSVNAQLPLIVEPSTASSLSSSPLAVSVKKEEKQDEQSVKEKEQQKQQPLPPPPPPPLSSSVLQNDGDEQSKKMEVESAEVESEEKGESLIRPLIKTEETDKEEEENSQSKEEIVNQNKNESGVVISGIEYTPETPVIQDKDKPIVDVQVEIELGSEVEIKQDVNGLDIDMSSSGNQSDSSTPEDSMPGKSDTAKARGTRSSSTSSNTSSADVSAPFTGHPLAFAEKVIGRRVSLKSRNECKDEVNKENKVTKELVKPVPDIAKLTSKLLYLWKDLKEVFRIPRLERQKRLEDEKEADRKAVEEQERKAKGLPIVYDPKAKRGIDNRDNTIAGILRLRDLRKKTVKRPSDDKKTVQNNLNSSSPASNTTNSNTVAPDSNSAPTPPKVNKEVHRMQFEMELMRKEYSAALASYHEQIKQYQEQMQMLQHQNHQQLPTSLSGSLPPNYNPSTTPQPLTFDSNHLPPNSLLHQSPFKPGQVFNSPNLINLPSHPPPPVPPAALGMFPDLFSVYGVNSDYSSNSGLTTPVTPVAPLTPSNDYHQIQQPFNLESHHPNLLNTSTTTSHQQFSHISKSVNSSEQDQLRSKDNQLDFGSPSNRGTSCNQSSNTTNTSNLSLTSNPLLIECTLSLNHTLMSDEKAVISTDYGVEYVPVKKSKKSSITASSSSSSSSLTTLSSSGTTTVTPTITSTTTRTSKENNSSNDSSSNSNNCNIIGSENLTNICNINDSHKTLFNSVYPAPGIYYLTPESCYFVPPPFDLHGHQTTPFVFENVPRPFSPSFTKESIQTALPPNWRCSKDQHGNVYYYNKVTKMVQWDLPTLNLVTETDDDKANSKSKREDETLLNNNEVSINTPIDEVTVQSQQSSTGQQTPVGEATQSQPQTPQSQSQPPPSIPPPPLGSSSDQLDSSLLPEKEPCTEEIDSTIDPSANIITSIITTDITNSNDEGDTPTVSTAQPSKETSPQLSSEEPLANGESGTPDNLITNDDSASECMGTPSHTLPGSYEPDPRKRRSSSTNSIGPNHNSNNSSNEGKSSLSIVKNFSSLMEINDGDLIASNRRDRSDKNERRIREKFKAEMSEHIKYCLNPYRKIDCRVGRILCNEDFKYVARRLTHFVMVKELKHCRNIEDLCCSETVKHKAKEYVKKYMANKGPIYRPESTEEICKDKEKCSPNS